HSSCSSQSLSLMTRRPPTSTLFPTRRSSDLGDMDFKVAGTDEGITALQMDIKIEGITEQIMEIALEKARAARLHILEQMNEVISEPRKQLADNAPTMTTMKIPSDKIREVIGKGDRKSVVEGKREGVGGG